MKFTREQLLKMYRQMVTIRYFEEGLPGYWDAGYLPGTGHSSAGEEAVAVGACTALDDKDYIISTHRAHGHLLAKGASPRILMAELFTKATGCAKGKGGTMHLSDFDRHILGTNGIVGGGITIAGGVGLALKMKKTKQVCLCFFGDGASNRGVFHEALNLASLRKINTVFICCNNQYALSTPVDRGCANPDISARAIAYDMPGYRVDGTDVVAVYEAVKSAVERARKGEGPSLVECVAYRLQGHNVLESRRPGYQPESEKKEWRENKDPIKIFKQKLTELGYITDEIAGEIEAEAKKEIDEAFNFAMESPEPGAEALFQDIYA
ncbi:thiamine pyrophosphate-dependent dehydrogenase E1 component subunit alpha [Chloroflexota bacterium]